MPVFETNEERTYFVTTIFIHPDFLASDEARSIIYDESFEIIAEAVIKECLNANNVTLIFGLVLGFRDV